MVVYFKLTVVYLKFYKNLKLLDMRHVIARHRNLLLVFYDY